MELRFFKPDSQTNNNIFIKVMTSSNTITGVVLDKQKMVKNNNLQVCFEKEYLEEQIKEQVYKRGLIPMYAFGIRNLEV